MNFQMILVKPSGGLLFSDGRDHRLRAVEEGRGAEEPRPASSRRSRHDVNTVQQLVGYFIRMHSDHAYLRQSLPPIHPFDSQQDRASPYCRSA